MKEAIRKRKGLADSVELNFAENLFGYGKIFTITLSSPILSLSVVMQLRSCRCGSIFYYKPFGDWKVAVRGRINFSNHQHC